MEHKQVMEFGKEILHEQFGYDLKDIQDCTGYLNQGEANPDLVTRDNKFCVEAGNLSLTKTKTIDSRMGLLLQKYSNVIWIPYPKETLFGAVPLIRVFVFNKNTFFPGKEELNDKIARARLELKSLEEQKRKIAQDIRWVQFNQYEVQDFLKRFNAFNSRMLELGKLIDSPIEIKNGVEV